MNKDRLIIHQVNYDGDSSSQLYYGRSEDDTLVGWEGSIIFHQDGSITMKAWNNHDDPYVVTICGNRTVVMPGEDQRTMTEIDEWLHKDEAGFRRYCLFDSDLHRIEE